MTTAKEARQVLSAFAPRDIDSAAEYALDLDAFAAAVERETLQDGERADVEARIRADERRKVLAEVIALGREAAGEIDVLDLVEMLEERL